MNDLPFAADWLIRATCCLSVASLLALWGLRGLRSPLAHRAICVVILLQGWVWFRWELPVLPAEETVAVVTQPKESLTVNNAVDSTMIDQAIRDFESGSVPAKSIQPASIATSTPARNVTHWQAWLGTVWLGGFLLTIIVSLAKYAHFQRSLPDIDELEPVFHHEWREVRRLSGLSTSIPLWGLAGMGPACGLMKRRIVVFVPTERWWTFTSEQRWAILLHEAGHLKRGDLWKSLLIRLLALPQWFNPLAWRMVRRFDEAAEWACDEIVLKHQGSCAPEFAEALLSLTVEKNTRPQFSAAANGHPLAERMRRLLSPSKPERTMTKTTVLVVALMLCAAANFVRLSAQEADPKQDPSNPVAAEPSPEVAPEKIVPSADAVLANDGFPIPLGNDFAADVNTGVLFDSFPAVLGEDLKPAAEPMPLNAVDSPVAPPVIANSPVTAESADDLSGFSVVDEFAEVKPITGAPTAVAGPPMMAASVKVETDTEAVIDMSEVFRRSIFFASETERLKAQLAQLDSQMEEMRARLQAQQRLLNDTEGDRHAELERQMIELQVEMEMLNAKSRQSLLQAEAEIYLNTYRRVRTVIAEYARENGIQTVRRVSSAVSEEDMNSQAILELINRDIVYSADEPRDITQDIIERLNAVDGHAGAFVKPPAATGASAILPPSVYPVPAATPGVSGPSAGYLPSTTSPAEPVYGDPSVAPSIPGTAPTGLPQPATTAPVPSSFEGSGTTTPSVPSTPTALPGR